MPRKLFWIVSAIIFVSLVVLLSIALTNNSPDNQLKKYGLVIGLSFFVFAYVFRIVYRKLYI